ncbi:MAG: transposase, partial [Brevinematia bacterium]
SHKGYSLTLKTYIQKLFFLEKQIEELSTLLDEEIQKWSPKEIDIISSIKGISRDLANRFIAEIEDIKKFSSAKKLIKYAGLDPVIKQSGKWKFFKGISKKGNAYLRDIFYQMAYGVVTWNSFFREYLKKKMAQYGSYRKAMIAVVNKLIRVIFAMLKKGEKFSLERVFPSIR